jgi:hypothetical protein
MFLGIFNTSLVDQKAKGVGLPMLRSNHEICVSGFRAKRWQKSDVIFPQNQRLSPLGDAPIYGISGSERPQFIVFWGVFSTK